MPPRSEDDTPERNAGIVIPLRSFTLGKARLGHALDATARVAMARAMAERVVRAAGMRPVVVVSSAPEVVEWASAHGLDRVGDPGSLDAAAALGRRWALDLALDRYAVVHADLPLVSSFDAVCGDGPRELAVVVPDHRDDGNPVLSLPTVTPFTFAYGPGSARRHAAHAADRGLEVRIVRDLALGFDVDVPADLERLARLRRAPTP